MTPEQRELFQQLDERVQECREQNDHLGAAQAMAQMAGLFTAMERLAEAAELLGDAANLAKLVDSPKDRSTYLRGMGAVLSRIDGRKEHALRAFRDAAAIALTAGDADLAVDAHWELVQYFGRLEDHSALISEVELAVKLIGEPSLKRATLYRVRARSWLARGRGVRSLQDIERALSDVEAVGEPRFHLELRMIRRNLEGMVPQPLSDTLDELLEEAERLEDTGALAELRSEQMANLLSAERWGEALELGQRVRADTLEYKNIVGHITASLMVAEALDRLERREDVLLVLLTTRTNTVRTLGVDAAQQVTAVLQHYERRWGSEVFAATFDGLKARMQPPSSPA